MGSQVVAQLRGELAPVEVDHRWVDGGEIGAQFHECVFAVFNPLTPPGGNYCTSMAISMQSNGNHRDMYALVFRKKVGKGGEMAGLQLADTQDVISYRFCLSSASLRPLGRSGGRGGRKGAGKGFSVVGGFFFVLLQKVSERSTT